MFLNFIFDCSVGSAIIGAEKGNPLVKGLLSLEPYPAPKFWINPEKKDFYSFNVDDFKLIDYNYHDFNIKIPVAI